MKNILNNKIPLDNTELKRIESLYDVYYMGYENNIGKDIYRLAWPMSDNCYFYFWKLPDEWYVVKNFINNMRNGDQTIDYFKCDQLEGLLKCIKDKRK